MAEVLSDGKVVMLKLDLIKSVGKNREVSATVVWDAEGRTVNGVSARAVPASVVEQITRHGVVTAMGTVAKFQARQVPGRKPKGADAAPMVAAKVVDLGGGVAVGFREQKPGSGTWVPVTVRAEVTASDFGF